MTKRKQVQVRNMRSGDWLNQAGTSVRAASKRHGSKNVELNFLSAILALAFWLWIGSPVNAATVTATVDGVAGVDSGTATTAGDTFHVVVELHLVSGESSDAAQLGLDFDTNQTIFTISPNPLTAANGTQIFDFDQLPNIQSPGENLVDQINSAGFNFGSGISGPTVFQMAAFDLVATGVEGDLNLILYSQQSFYSSGGTIQQNITGTIGTFSFVSGAVVPLPAAAWMGLTLLGGLAGCGFIRHRIRSH